MLIYQTNRIARDLGAGFEGLSFELSAIGDYLAATDLRSAAAGTRGGEPDTRAASAADKGTSEASQTLADAEGAGDLLVLVALHACDTATDDALYCGVRNRADVIVTAPCCHKEVRRQLDAARARAARKAQIGGSQSHPLGDLLRFGTFRERQGRSWHWAAV